MFVKKLFVRSGLEYLTHSITLPDAPVVALVPNVQSPLKAPSGVPTLAPYMLLTTGPVTAALDKSNIFDAPPIEVIVLASNPPVQDSAKEILSFFLVRILIKDFII